MASIFNPKEDARSISDSFLRIKNDMDQRIRDIQDINDRIKSLEESHSNAIGQLNDRLTAIEHRLLETSQQMQNDMRTIKELLSTNHHPTAPSHTEVILRYEMDKMKSEIRDELRNIHSSSYGKKIRENQLESEVLRKIERNKKEIIKGKILESLRNNSMSVPEIKEMIVDQKR